MNNKKEKIVGVEVLGKMERLAVVCSDFLRAREGLKEANKVSAKYKGNKKTAESYLILNLGSDLTAYGYTFSSVPAKVEKSVSETLDIEALVEYIKENNPDIIAHFSQERIIEKEIKAKLSVIKDKKGV